MAKAPKPVDRLKSDAKFKSAVLSFVEAAHKSGSRSDDDAAKAFESGAFRMVDGVIFHQGVDVRAAEKLAVSQAEKVLGATLGHERDLSDTLWKAATKALLNGEDFDKAAVAKLVVKAVCEAVSAEYLYICPNYGVGLSNDITSVEIGPVSIKRTDALAAEIATTKLGEKWAVGLGDPGMKISDKKVIFNMTDICWAVKVHASKKNLDEEALWLIDVATSIIRLTTSDLGDFVPRNGDFEISPVIAGHSSQFSLRISEASSHSGNLSNKGRYIVGDQAAKDLRSAAITERFASLFDAPTSTLGERLHRSSGWLTRARRTVDRSERLLLFFTALESLLSGNQSDSPVTETLSRHCSVLWDDNPVVRIEVFRTMKSLYGKRSDLIHRGLRAITQRDVDTVQYVCENVLGRVLEQADFSQSVDDFQRELAEAGFGTAWPPSPTSA